MLFKSVLIPVLSRIWHLLCCGIPAVFSIYAAVGLGFCCYLTSLILLVLPKLLVSLLLSASLLWLTFLAFMLLCGVLLLLGAILLTSVIFLIFLSLLAALPRWPIFGFFHQNGPDKSFFYGGDKQIKRVTCGKFAPVSLLPAVNANLQKDVTSSVVDDGGASWFANICKNFLNKSKSLYCYKLLKLGAWEKMIHENNMKQTISWHGPFNKMICRDLKRQKSSFLTIFWKICGCR
jgi:hypothetical protein